MVTVISRHEYTKGQYNDSLYFLFKGGDGNFLGEPVLFISFIKDKYSLTWRAVHSEMYDVDTTLNNIMKANEEIMTHKTREEAEPILKNNEVFAKAIVTKIIKPIKEMIKDYLPYIGIIKPHINIVSFVKTTTDNPRLEIYLEFLPSTKLEDSVASLLHETSTFVPVSFSEAKELIKRADQLRTDFYLGNKSE